MKKIILVLLAVMLIGATANAQYKVNKTKYDYRTYASKPGDPYNPAVAGVCSFLIPGLGQMISSEVGRGFVFLGGAVVSAIIAGIVPGVGLVLIIGVDVLAIIDAIRVAKVNDLAFRDQGKTSILMPPLPDLTHQVSTVGLTMRFRF